MKREEREIQIGRKKYHVIIESDKENTIKDLIKEMVIKELEKQNA